MGGDLVRISAEWARWGKREDDRGYEVLAFSGAHFSRENFHRLLQRFSPGTPERLPQVTIGWAGQRQADWVGIGIQEASDRPDRVGRRVSETRFFCVPYDALRARPVSYLDLFTRFWDVELPEDGGPVVVEARPLRPELIDIPQKAENAAELLVSRKPVCVVADDRVSLHDRLRFIDAVAALLPYGVRTRFSASTWTSSTADHKIRLSFTDEPREDSYNLFWNTTTREDPRDLPAPLDLRIAEQYGQRIREGVRRDHVVRRLAEAVAPVSFEDPHQLLAALLRERPEARAGGDGPATSDPVAAVEGLAAALKAGEREKAGSFLNQLSLDSKVDPPEPVRRRLRDGVMMHRLLSRNVAVEGPARIELYRALFALCFQRVLTDRGYEQILEFVGRDSYTGEHALALSRLAPVSRRLRFTLARQHSPGELEALLGNAGAHEIVAVAADPETDRSLREELYRALLRCPPSGELTEALVESVFLCDRWRDMYPGSEDIQFERLQNLLWLAYPGDFGPHQLQEALTPRRVMPTLSLVAAAAARYGQGAGAALVHNFLAVMVDKAAFDPKERVRVLRTLEDVPVPVYSPAQVAQAGARHAPEDARPGRFARAVEFVSGHATVIGVGLFLFAVVVALVAALIVLI
ncbi:hypothetical protein [Actinocorallia sp. A-T 12471]|uniref:hypothetical protein n=1 Tax=Actinocorallia sp. A-T 12471 TaxID=3089813 RepID=UPI0029CBF54B|nr:hypothetical protein [Actinocorallia sp. A-T 12471]MDX6739058.1 hypothetical protein [Actinocorallia sp. A-T 12471]